MSDQARKVQVVVFRKQDNEFYCLLLKTNPERGSFWQNVTGSVDDGEDFETAAKRELFEETGIKSNVTLLDYQIEFFDRWKRNVLEKCYFAISNTDKIQISVEEHTDYEWVPVNEITPTNFKFETNYEAFKRAMKCLS
ncbi:NUDIX pyrophosphatase [Bacteriovorax sp. Seq25_V]|uniref:NUDIX hydrolase n=1 Tax=Bacteriovorax sp. Seq25_V TaxID=1201288 RepID=UPI00038A1987|nr:NUDIX domain-containing protein [Bacteriovorax sp. Seq25_V]EQC44816.1 NUDIX domain protein [Bacteriovorax sp. Seq25_V]